MNNPNPKSSLSLPTDKDRLILAKVGKKSLHQTKRKLIVDKNKALTKDFLKLNGTGK